ncbi:Dyp-type peroxidase domain-containing protein [Streptomyces sp. BV333]|uniref:Dyp-type peroxidase n=1 Tax=Streptomyces sp. BV333 TaxID=2849673 RepID=UPI0026D7CAEE|nr:Dyp-type peroxidase domain-containing protein [Streptomyces sp. BV333]
MVASTDPEDRGGEAHRRRPPPGDLLYHLRAASPDLIVEFEKILLEAFGDAVTAVDDVTGFRYFDGRDLLEFADGTANPDGADLSAATLVDAEDPAYAGGSYVVVQKYLHDLPAWRGQPHLDLLPGDHPPQLHQPRDTLRAPGRSSPVRRPPSMARSAGNAP